MILGRRLAKELGYVTYPDIPLPKLDSEPVKQKVIPMLKIQASSHEKVHTGRCHIWILAGQVG